MKHGKKHNHLNRENGHRASMLANMACSLLQHKRINTTSARARELRKFVEPIITRAKVDTVHNRREAFRKLRNKYAVTELFMNVSLAVGDRQGGYTRLIKLGNRLGDNAAISMIELVDFNTIYTPKESLDNSEKVKKTRRSRAKAKDSGASSSVTLSENQTSNEE